MKKKTEREEDQKIIQYKMEEVTPEKEEKEETSKERDSLGR